MTRHFQFASDDQAPKEYLLNPALPDAAEQVAKAEKLAARSKRYLKVNSAAVAILMVSVAAMGVTAFLSLFTLTVTAAVVCAAGALTAIASAVAALSASRKAARTRARWVLNGDALCTDVLRGRFVAGDCTDEAKWEALHLIHVATEHHRHVRWAASALAAGRLPSGAHELVGAAEQRTRLLFQRAADLLDPHATAATELLRTPKPDHKERTHS